MNILILEDEKPAQEKLLRLLNDIQPDARVLTLDSVRSAICYLEKAHPYPDLVFMDVELSDGVCFEIFNHTNINAPIIITTAYDQYAINALKVGSVDYLLKPINPQELDVALKKAKRIIEKNHANENTAYNYQDLREILNKNHTKERFTVRIGDRIIIIDTKNIAYFFAEDKYTYIVTKDGNKYISDLTLDNVEESVDTNLFFRLSRGCIAHIDSIKSVSKYINGRLKVELTPTNMISSAPIVSRQRAHAFLEWIEG